MKQITRTARNHQVYIPVEVCWELLLVRLAVSVSTFPARRRVHMAWRTPHWTNMFTSCLTEQVDFRHHSRSWEEKHPKVLEQKRTRLTVSDFQCSKSSFSALTQLVGQQQCQLFPSVLFFGCTPLNRVHLTFYCWLQGQCTMSDC